MFLSHPRKEDRKQLLKVIHVYYPDCGHGSLGIHLSKLIKLCILNMCSSLPVDYTITKLLKMINETCYILLLSYKVLETSIQMLSFQLSII